MEDFEGLSTFLACFGGVLAVFVFICVMIEWPERQRWEESCKAVGGVVVKTTHNKLDCIRGESIKVNP